MKVKQFNNHQITGDFILSSFRFFFVSKFRVYILSIADCMCVCLFILFIIMARINLLSQVSCGWFRETRYTMMNHHPRQLFVWRCCFLVVHQVFLCSNWCDICVNVLWLSMIFKSLKNNSILLMDPLNLQALESNFMGRDLQYLMVRRVWATICCSKQEMIIIIIIHTRHFK